MGFLSHIARSGEIAGLHISDTHVSLCAFSNDAKDLSQTRSISVELPEGTVVHGKVADERTLARALGKLRSRTRARSVVLALPHTHIFTKHLTFPKTITPSRLREAVELAKEWRIPFEEEASYSDAEVPKEGGARSATLTSVERTVITPFIRACNTAGFTPVAAESELVALARTLAPTDAHYATILEQRDAQTIAVFSNAHLLFARTLPKEHTKKSDVQAAYTRITEYTEAVFGRKPTKRTLAKLTVTEEISTALEKNDGDRALLPVFGTLMRARMPRGEDTLNSLLPLGTELAFEYQKLDAYTRLIGTSALITATLFLAAFAAAWDFMRTERNELSLRSISETTQIDTELLTARSEDMERFTRTVDTLAPLAAQEPLWSNIIGLLRTHTNAGIAITDITIEKPEEPVRVAGIARSREHLNAFYSALRDAEEISRIEAPITGADLRTNIPFTMYLNPNTAESLYRTQ